MVIETFMLTLFKSSAIVFADIEAGDPSPALGITMSEAKDLHLPLTERNTLNHI
jgi:hypothetical protein